MNKIDLHLALCNEMHETYKKKNADYGDSFHSSYEKFGPIAGVVRISDKYERLCNLILNSKDRYVSDETVIDTLKDMANYAIMLAMELDKETMI